MLAEKDCLGDQTLEEASRYAGLRIGLSLGLSHSRTLYSDESEYLCLRMGSTMQSGQGRTGKGTLDNLGQAKNRNPESHGIEYASHAQPLSLVSEITPSSPHSGAFSMRPFLQTPFP